MLIFVSLGYWLKQHVSKLWFWLSASLHIITLCMSPSPNSSIPAPLIAISTLSVSCEQVSNTEGDGLQSSLLVELDSLKNLAMDIGVWDMQEKPVPRISPEMPKLSTQKAFFYCLKIISLAILYVLVGTANQINVRSVPVLFVLTV